MNYVILPYWGLKLDTSGLVGWGVISSSKVRTCQGNSPECMRGRLAAEMSTPAS